MASGIEFPPEKRAEIFALIGQGRSLAEIAELTGVAVQTIYGWTYKDHAFAEAYRAAREIVRLVNADDAWKANGRMVADPKHPQHFQAVKLAIDKNDPDAGVQRQGGADADGIAEAIDRFTQLVAGLAKPAPDLQGALTGRTELAPPNTD